MIMVMNGKQGQFLTGDYILCTIFINSNIILQDMLERKKRNHPRGCPSKPMIKMKKRRKKQKD